MKLGFTRRSFRRPRLVNLAIGLTIGTLAAMALARFAPEWRGFTGSLLLLSFAMWLLAGTETLLSRRRKRAGRRRQ